MIKSHIKCYIYVVLNSEDQAEHGNGNSTATKVLYIFYNLLKFIQ